MDIRWLKRIKRIGMTVFLFLKYLHIMLFAFWLGTDMGTFYSSRFVVDPNLTPGQRSTALQILLGCDMGPKIAMPLIMPTGIHMASIMGLFKIGTAGTIAIWIAGFLWLGIVLAIHFGKNQERKHQLEKIDFWLRPVIVLVVGAFAVYSLFEPTYIVASYLSWKLLVVCGLILCGLGIRHHLAKFKPAFVDLITGKEKEDTNAVIRRSMDNCMPYVYGIWIGVSLNAALGLHLFNFQ